MQIPFFDLTRQNQELHEEYQEIFNKFLAKGQTILGEEVSLFEQEFSKYTKISHCVTCGNATDALEMVLEALDIGHGDEVILPAFGWVSIVSSVLSRGVNPVFVDVGADGNLNPDLITERLTSRTKAVLLIHLFGHPCKVEVIKSFCEAHNLRLIEDCAQAHGAKVGGKHVGNFGDAAIFSFYPTKNLGAFGDGGAILTNDQEIYQSISQIRNYGRDQDGSFQIIGRNSRMDELQAAFLRRKLNYLDGWNIKRRAIAVQYNEVLGSFIDSDQSVWYKYVFSAENRDHLKQTLDQKGIGTGIYYPFQLDQLEFITHKKPPLKVSKMLSEHILSLPLFPELTNEEISYICEVLKALEIRN